MIPFNEAFWDEKVGTSQLRTMRLARNLLLFITLHRFMRFLPRDSRRKLGMWFWEIIMRFLTLISPRIRKLVYEARKQIEEEKVVMRKNLFKRVSLNDG